MDKKGDKMTKLSMNKFINMAVSDMNRRNVMEPNFDKYPDGVNENKISFTEYDDDQLMNCPICGFNCTHITGVEVFARGEDAKEHIHTAVETRHPRNVIMHTYINIHIRLDIYLDDGERERPLIEMYAYCMYVLVVVAQAIYRHIYTRKHTQTQ